MQPNKGRKGKRQKIWEYMRRNRVFEIHDLVKVFEVKTPALRAYIKGLLDAKYIRELNKERFLHQQFVLVDDIGLVAPMVKKENKWK